MVVSEPAAPHAGETPVPRSLGGLRVLDLSRVLAGPWCTQVLGDLGADVVKVERPGAGDDTRGWGPPFLRDRLGAESAESAYFLGANRNKRSITIDLAHPQGHSLVRQLAREADVLVENFKVGDLARHGLDFASLHALNPQLVYCSVTGYGQTGPYRDRAGYDYAVQGLGGLMSVTGPSPDEIADGSGGAGPQKVGVAVADLFTGMYATVGILAALRHRDRDGFRRGLGQHLDMALLDTQVAMLANLGANYLVSGEVPGRAGNAHRNIVPYQVFEAADGPFILAVGNDGQFEKLCEVLGAPALARDERYAKNAGRVRHRAALVPRLAALLRERPRAGWLAALEAAGVPCGPINDLAQVFDDPQVRARGMVETLEHPLADALRLVASPLKLSATPAATRRAPPLLGQHAAEVLADWLGWSEAQVAACRAAGALGSSARQA
ncbi:MAG TPA: CaiB/BaiF CoA-transferase family protein [Methylibium sp.]|uniref:CaiB/BaiF CoA transferase family protein n=1 Tax=Methylibium sp. TaxID=2067992 RepID=UPI002DBC8E8A|nr:CaiB/BaiF CoA-transferase family protein [Methylibium sp.]HEU4459012.1 CaiB/BaiF CoA-transferase family protein [Methylibium sp.]